MTNSEKIAAALGTTRWVVAARFTARLRARYDVCITPAKFAALRVELGIA